MDHRSAVGSHIHLLAKVQTRAPFSAVQKVLSMVQNRIKRYEALWADPPRDPKPAQDGIPPGFTVQLLGHLSPDQRQTVANQRDLYQWAFDQARRDCDQKLFWDWSI